MTNELWVAVLQNLIMGFAFLVPLAFCRIADIAFGTLAAFKLENLKFDWRKFVTGIVATLIMLIGLACLITGITMIPELLKYYNIQIVDTEVLNDTIDIVMILATFVGSALTYGKDAFVKAKEIFGHKK